MTIDDFARLVRSMREAQTVSFRTRAANHVVASRDWERRVDAAVREVLEPPQPGLFDRPSPKEAD